MQSGFAFLSRLAPYMLAMEICGGAHFGGLGIIMLGAEIMRRVKDDDLANRLMFVSRNGSRIVTAFASSCRDFA